MDPRLMNPPKVPKKPTPEEEHRYRYERSQQLRAICDMLGGVQIGGPFVIGELHQHQTEEG